MALWRRGCSLVPRALAPAVRRAAFVKFADLPVPAPLVRAVEENFGFSLLSDEQARALPACLAAERDVVIRARTGTGKTLAYLLAAAAQLGRGLLQGPAVLRHGGQHGLAVATQLCTIPQGPTFHLAQHNFAVAAQLCGGGARVARSDSGA